MLCQGRGEPAFKALEMKVEEGSLEPGKSRESVERAQRGELNVNKTSRVPAAVSSFRSFRWSTGVSRQLG